MFFFSRLFIREAERESESESSKKNPKEFLKFYTNMCVTIAK